MAFNVEAPEFDLFRAAVVLGRVVEPELNVEAVLRQVGGLVGVVRQRTDPDAAFPVRLNTLIHVFSDELGFGGDVENYDAPGRSYLHEVLHTRRGLPIALSVLFCELAQRAGIDARGVAFPAHFIVRVEPPEGEGATPLFVDPFHQGRLRTRDDLAAQLASLSSYRKLSDADLEPAAPHVVLARMLNNLRVSYARRNDALHLERVLSRMLIFKPGHPAVLLERARARQLILDFEGARADAVAAREVTEGGYADMAEAFLRDLERMRTTIH